MFVQSGGALVRKGVTFTGSWGWDDPNLWSGILSDRWGTYGEIYRTQLWVSVVVNKLANAQARLPLPVYQRGEDNGRRRVPDHPYARLLRNPSSKHDPFTFYSWTIKTLNIYGAVAWAKIRDAGGRPIELALLHPAGLTRDEDEKTGRVTWTFRNSRVEITFPDHDIVYFHTYHPDDPCRGMSPLEPLRATLENEDAARRATSSFWQRGARPGVALTHPGQLSQPALSRLKLQWDAAVGGPDNVGTTVVLEEGMKPEIMQITAEEAQYIDTRRLNREEVAANYDIPPPVIGILDRATFSNITEQMRSMYRDVMPPRLSAFESVLESELRASRRPGASEPDFGDDVYAEYLLDEVLRGAPEVRAAAIKDQIFSGQLTPNEGRQLENRPPMPGGDVLLVQSAMVPLDRVADGMVRGAPPAVKSLDDATLRTVMGRLSRPVAPGDVDDLALVAGLNGHSDAVLAELSAARAAGEDMPALRDRIRALAAHTEGGRHG